LWASVLSGLPKVKGSRLLVLSSAGSPSHPSYKRWEQACAGGHWRASLTVGPSPWWSREDVESARSDLTAAEFRRYVLCEWAEADDSLATADDVAACVGDFTVLEPRRGVQYLISLDVGTRRDSTVLSVGHLEVTGAGRRVVVDRVMRWTGSRLRPVPLGDVEEALLAVWRAYGRPRLVYDLHQAAQLTERLRSAGVRCDEYTFSVAGVNRLARALYGALRDRAVLLPDDEELIAELGAVRLVETGPGLVRLDHRSGEHDDQAVTVAMLIASFMDRPSGGLKWHFPTGERRPMRPAHAFTPASDGPPVPVVDVQGRPRRAPAPRDRFDQLTPPGIRRRRGEGYIPPGRENWR